MEIVTVPVLKDNFCYVVVPPRGQSCAVVDPGEAGPVFEFLRSRDLRATEILLTHHHPDHVDGAVRLRERFGSEIRCSEIDLPRLPFATKTVKDEEQFKILGSEVFVIATPGHTLGQVTYWWPDEAALFTGDTLFSAGCGRLFEGTPAQMHDSLNKLARLPGHTRVYFGHEYTLNNLDFVKANMNLAKDRRSLEAAVDHYRRTCESALAEGRPTTPSDIAIELRVNPFLAATSVEEFARWREARNHW